MKLHKWSSIKAQMNPERLARLEDSIKEELEKIHPMNRGEQSPDFYCPICDVGYCLPCEKHEEPNASNQNG